MALFDAPVDRFCPENFINIKVCHKLPVDELKSH